MEMDFNVGLLVARVVFGLTMSAHGAQKLFGWFGGHGLAGTGQFFDSVGFRPGRVMAAVAGLSEVTSGLLIALGLLGPVGPAVMLAVMIVASSATRSDSARGNQSMLRNARLAEENRAGASRSGPAHR